VNTLSDLPDAQPEPQSQLTPVIPCAADPLIGPRAEPAAPPDPIWTGLDIFRVLIMALVLLFLSAVAMLAVVPGTSVKSRALRLSSAPELLIAAQMLAYSLLLGYMYILVTKERRSPRFWKALHWNWPAKIWPYASIGLAMQAVFLLVERFLPFPKETPFDALLRRPATIVLIAVFAVTLGPLMEELFFRGFLYPVLVRGFEPLIGKMVNLVAARRRDPPPFPKSAPEVFNPVLAHRFGVSLGISFSALGFGLLHAAQYGYSWASVFLIFLVGLVLGMVRARNDSVAAGYLVHAAYNATIILLLLVATGGFRHLEKLGQ
jgi:uncharacterized protein